MTTITRRSRVLGAMAVPFDQSALGQSANITRIVVPFPPGGTGLPKDLPPPPPPRTQARCRSPWRFPRSARRRPATVVRNRDRLSGKAKFEYGPVRHR
jgi:hypothetical protein